MHTIHLFQFLQTSLWGPVKAGMTLDQVKSYLGEPDSVTEFWTGYTDAQYYWTEFFFDTETDSLVAIQNDNLFPLELEADGKTIFQNDHFRFQIGFLAESPTWTRAEVTQRLQAEGIPFQPKTMTNYTVLQFASGAYLDFHTSAERGGPPTPPEEDQLIGFRYFPHF